MILALLIVWETPAVQAVPPLNLPPGFNDEVVVDGLLAPRAFAFAPDGRLFILERGSATSNDINFASLRIFKNGALLPQRALTVNTCGDSERGLLGIALDPNFASNGYIYLYYTRQATSGPACAYNTYADGNPNGPRNRISRFTMSGDLAVPGSEKVLVDNIVTDIGFHNAGDLQFGLDGYLYASTGDGGIPTLSPDTWTLNGKILRILPTAAEPRGYVTTGNPFHSTSGARYCGTTPPESSTGPCREVYAYGLRNPFRFSIIPSMSGIPGAGQPIVADVGGGAWEEIDIVTAGGNYGYPTREGPCSAGVLCTPPFQPSGFADPIYAYPHEVLNENLDSAVIGGAFYTGSTSGLSYPPEYVNNYFLAEFVRGFIRRLTYDSGSGTWNAVTPEFATGGSGIIGLKTGLDGNLYFMTFTSDSERTGQIHRITYTASANQPPYAQISADPISGPVGTAFNFSAAGSSDPDGNLPLTYHWNFGDGVTTTTTTPNVTHTYNSAGTRTVTLTVTDSGNPPATSAPATVNVYPGNNPPSGQIVLTNLTDASRVNMYYAGDTFAYSVANASDDQPLPADAFSWEVVFHHREHTHPFLPYLPNASGQFSIPNTGETDPVVWYRVYLHIRDVGGLMTTVHRDILPITTNITLMTNQAGGDIVVEGATFDGPHTVTRVVGLRIGIGVPSPQSLGGVNYSFNSWSQGGGQWQTITVPAAPMTFTAYLVPGTPTNSPTPLTPTPTATNTQPAPPPAHTHQPTATFTPTPSFTPSPTQTWSPTPSYTPSATLTLYLAPTATATPTPLPPPPPVSPP